MAIRRYQRRQRPTAVQSPVVRPVGEISLAQSIQAGGQMLSSVAVSMAEKRDRSLISESRYELTMAQLEKSKDYADRINAATTDREIEEIVSEWGQKGRNEIPKMFESQLGVLSSRARSVYEADREDISVRNFKIDGSIIDAANKRRADIAIAQSLGLANAGETGQAFERLDAGKPYLSQSQSLSVQGQIIEIENENKIQAVSGEVRKMAQIVGWDKAIQISADAKWGESRGYTTEQTAKGISAAKQMRDVIEAAQKEAKEREIQTGTAELYKRAFAKDASIIQDLDEALDMGIAPATVKDVRKIATTPYADAPDYVAEQTVRDAIGKAALGSISKGDALRSYGENLHKMTAEQGGRMIAMLDTDLDRSDEYWRSEATSRMEELIRDKDPFSGSFSDNQAQIIGAAEASVQLEYERIKHPDLSGTDLLARAIEIAQLKRIEIDQQEKAKKDPVFDAPRMKQSPQGLESVWNDFDPQLKAFAIEAMNKGVSADAVLERYRQIRQSDAR